MEARIGADVYNEKMLLDEFLYRSGDTHAAYAKAVFAEELKDVPVERIKKERPDLRSKVKSVEFKKEIYYFNIILYSNKYYCHEYKFQNLEPYLSNEIMQTE